MIVREFFSFFKEIFYYYESSMDEVDYLLTIDTHEILDQFLSYPIHSGLKELLPVQDDQISNLIRPGSDDLFK